MTPDRMRQCLAAMHWSQQELSRTLGVDPRQVRRWATGSRVPPDVAAWLEACGQWHEENPPPARKSD
jgi:transcriptional regulator with XRE-family HTH domain